MSEPNISIDLGDKSVRHLIEQVPTNEYEVNIVAGAKYWMLRGFPNAIYDTQFESGTTCWNGVPHHLVTTEMIEIEASVFGENYKVPIPEDIDSGSAPSILKKDQIIALYESGVTDIAEIVRNVYALPSYVAQVLQTAGLIQGYFDLYITSSEHNVYSRFFKNVLRFKTVEDAEESCKKLSRLYDYFERLGDRAGQHQACVLALTGKNRARWSGKQEVSEIFNIWLNGH